ncbi:MAG: VIT1/CCC1 family protein [Thaumarchaeota archaeon]|nr:VIT1/CCC1 family protein [Nitrososphaerota archaeon]
MSSETLQQVALESSQDEINDYEVYRKLSRLRIEKNQEFRGVLQSLSEMEHRHYEFWKRYVPDAKVDASALRVYLSIIMRVLFGTTFASKFLERNEGSVIKRYRDVAHLIPEADRAEFDRMLQDEVAHEKEFEQKTEGGAVKYISFVVLGLADAVVEIAGIHAGSLGIYDSTRLAGLAGIVAGAAASIAMASAAYAQAKQGFEGSASLSAAYTGVSYFATALILASPYFITEQMVWALGTSLIFAISLIAFISFYSSVISDKPFTRDFLEMTGIMLGATAALYVLGTVIHILFHITIG